MSISRIRASVTTVAPVVSVQLAGGSAVDATYNKSFKPVVTVIVPMAAIQWINVVYAAQVDTRGLNRVVKEITATLDVSSLHLFKAAYDSMAAVDETTHTLRKALVEPLTTSELRAFSLSRAITDTVDATDDLFGAANLDDEQVMFLIKSLQPDYIVMADNIDTIQVGKRALDTAVTGDVIGSRVLGKSLVDVPVTSEILVRSLSKQLTDTADVSDELNGSFITDDGQVMFMIKSLPVDYVTNSDANAKQFGKPALDLVVTGDVLLPFALGKGIEDVPVTTEKSLFDVAKPVQPDVVLALEAAVAAIAKPFEDLIFKPAEGPSQYDTYAFSYFLADYCREGFPALLVGKHFADLTQNTDISSRVIGKALSEFPLTGEVKGFAIGKALTDTVKATDDFYGAANVDDDQTVLYAKTTSDVVGKSDLTFQTTGKALTEAVNNNDAGSFVWTDYWDIGYTATASGVYVGNSRNF